MSSSTIDKNTCRRCKMVKPDEEMAGYCSDSKKAYCETCYSSGKITKFCDDIDCRLHWDDDCWKCDGCGGIHNPNDEEDEDQGEICLTRGIFCDQCWDSYESLDKCRKKGCAMCERIYEAETVDWWNCQCCSQLKPDVDGDRICGDCYANDTPSIGYTMTVEEEKEEVIKALLSPSE